VIGVAIVIAVGEARPDFSQVTCFDWLEAAHAKGPWARLPAIHQDEFHVAPPNAKPYAVAEGWETLRSMSDGLKPRQPSAIALLACLEADGALL
jgi:hypothetical protein